VLIISDFDDFDLVNYFTPNERRVWRNLASSKSKPQWLKLPGPRSYWKKIDLQAVGFERCPGLTGFEEAWKMVWVRKMPLNFDILWFPPEGELPSESDLRCLWSGKILYQE
jgi:hypothetical protein